MSLKCWSFIVDIELIEVIIELLLPEEDRLFTGCIAPYQLALFNGSLFGAPFEIGAPLRLNEAIVDSEQSLRVLATNKLIRVKFL